MKHIGLVFTLLLAFSFTSIQAQNCIPKKDCKPSDCKKTAKASKNNKSASVLTLFDGVSLTTKKEKKTCQPAACKGKSNAKAMNASKATLVSNNKKSKKSACQPGCKKAKKVTAKATEKKTLVAKNE